MFIENKLGMLTTKNALSLLVFPFTMRLIMTHLQANEVNPLKLLKKLPLPILPLSVSLTHV